MGIRGLDEITDTPAPTKFTEKTRAHVGVSIIIFLLFCLFAYSSILALSQATWSVTTDKNEYYPNEGIYLF
ncbi:MAG: hypothetical protein ACTSVF_01380, partial [Candidatus Asgardarchaeia archaeon]